MNEPVAFVGPSLNTAPNASVTADWGEVNDVATESRRRWGRATWFGIATYFAWSPCRIVNQFLPQGSTTRGAVLTLIPLVGVLAVLRLRTAGKRIQIDLLVVLLAVLVIWQVISVERTAGTGYLTHVIPGAALLLLAIVARLGLGNVVAGHSICNFGRLGTFVLPPYSWMDRTICAYGAGYY